MIQIDKNVALPDVANKKKYPIREMVVGDSFLVATDRERFNAMTLAKSARPNAKFVSRKVEGGYRIWLASIESEAK